MKKLADHMKTKIVLMSLRDVEMALCGLKIWRQVVVAQTFAEMRDGLVTPYQETLVDIDQAIDRLEDAKGKF